jgi:hypothetical protein
MPARKLTDQQLREAADAYRRLGLDGHTLIGIPKKRFESRITAAVAAGVVSRAERRTVDQPPEDVANAPADDSGILKERIRTLEAAIKAHKRETLDEELVKREIIGLRDLLAEAAPPSWLLKPSRGGTTGTPTLFASDWHWGEVVAPAQVNGVNEFNLEIAHRRAKHMVTTATDLLLGHMA